MNFFARLFPVAALLTVFLFMQLAKRSFRTPRSPIDRESSAVAVIAPNTNLTTSNKVARACTPALNAPQSLVKYFDERGGFWRVGRLLSSRKVNRGRQKGQTILTIDSALHRMVTRNADEVEWVVQ
jgi:hypothetical protein